MRGYRTSPDAERANVVDVAINMLILHSTGKPEYVEVSVAKRNERENSEHVTLLVARVRNPQLRGPSCGTSVSARPLIFQEGKVPATYT